MSRPKSGPRLRISQIRCYQLPDKDAFSIKKFFGGDISDKIFDRKVDPYVTFKIEGSEDVLRTKTKTDDNDPEWKKEVTIYLGRPVQFNDNLIITVYDEENFGQDINIGQAKASLDGLARNVKDEEPTKRYKYQLHVNNRPTEAQIEFRIDYISDEVDVVDRGRNVQYKDNDEKVKRERHLEHKYPEKEADFKIFIKLHEVRQFVDNYSNMKVVLTVGDIIHTTKLQLATNNPKYDQEFWFSFKCKPNELFDKKILFEVLDVPDEVRKPLQKNDEDGEGKTLQMSTPKSLGIFKQRVEFIYREKKHRLKRKWLVLSEPADYQSNDHDEMLSSPTIGYVKVTAAIYGPREKTTKIVKTKEFKDEDTQENVLAFSDFTTRKTLSVRLYHAEDLPQMDLTSFRSRDRSKVDAYVKVWFNGKEVKSKVDSSYRPEFNQELLFTFDFPCVCDILRLELWDKDTMSDECIGVREIKISNIFKHSENGFLPTFGPAYVNFYGSNREYSTISDNEIMNTGQCEGMSYRGRLFLEIGQKEFDSTIPYALREITLDERSHLDAFKRKSQYFLNVTFISATMFSEFDHSVRFEVSIGINGNKLDPLVDPQSSCTPPINPIYDGCKHYYLPWSEEKPCCIVESYWEDVEYRLIFINYLHFVLKEFEYQMSILRNQSKFDVHVLKTLVIVLKQLANNFMTTQEETQNTMKNQNNIMTKLDQKLFNHRLLILHSLQQQVLELAEKIKILISSDTILDQSQHKKLITVVPQFIEKLIITMKDLCKEEQDSIPDIIISMIVGEKRKAYCRIPANKLLFCTNEKFNGECCQKLQNVIMKYPSNTSQRHDVPCCISFIAYLGKSKHLQSNWWKNTSFSTYAEVYEIVHGLESLSYTQITDLDGKVVAKAYKPFVKTSDWQEDIEEKNILSYKWEWGRDSKWEKVSLENSDQSDILPRVTWDEIFVTQSRLPFGDWINLFYTNAYGDIMKDFKTDASPPLGYQWTTKQWLPDNPVPPNCDEEGWQYANDLRSATWTSDCLFIHRCRRKHLTRKRELKPGTNVEQLKTKIILGNDYWMYATAFNEKYHFEKRLFDTVKRRKLQRKLTRKGNGQKTFLSRGESFARVEASDVVKKKKSSRIFKIGRSDAIPEDDSHAHTSEKKKEKKKHDKHRDKHTKDDSDNEDESFEDVAGERQEEGEITREKDFENCYQLLPTIYQHVQVTKWQLRICIWQGCNLKSEDVLTNSSDPYVVGTFLHYSALTRVLKETLNPIWDETLYFEEIQLYGTPEMYENSSPDVILDLWDHDENVKHDALGRCIFKPTVITDFDNYDLAKTRLTWYPVMYKNKQQGQILATAQLIHLKDGVKEKLSPPPIHPQKVEKHQINVSAPPKFYKLPDYLRPTEEDVLLEFVYFGVRSQSKMAELIRAKNATVELVIGGHIIKGRDVYDKNALKKEKTALKLVTDSYYFPPVILNAYEHRYGMKTLIGSHVAKDFQIKAEDKPAAKKKRNLQKGSTNGSTYRETTIENIDDPNLIENLKKSRKEEVHLDWWCKYHATKGEEKKANKYTEKRHEKMVWYDKELENVEEFKKVTIFNTFQLTKDEGDIVGEMKGVINCMKRMDSLSTPSVESSKVPPLSLSTCDVSDSLSEEKRLGFIQKLNKEYIVRVYILRALKLQPSDINGKADPYVTISLGKEKISTKDRFVKNDLNPFFGECFQFHMTSQSKDLIITVKDYDRIARNDLIGQTVVDLESRLIWNYKLGVGLPKKYYKEGPFKWRDTCSPVEMLQKAVKAKFKRKGEFSDNDTVFTVAGEKIAFKRCLADYEPYGETYVPVTYETRSKKKRLALNILNDTTIEFLTPYIKEHIETRTLKNDLYPDESQGRLEMFIEIFPKHDGIPGPMLNIEPRKPRNYILRAIIYRTAKIELQEKEFLSSKDMSDIYVKGWLRKEKKKQRTDIHYRSMDGEGLFNWRMVFPFKYIPEEKNMVFEHKDHFWEFDSTEVHHKPILRFEAWDSDTFSLDDYLGFIELNLSRLRRPKSSYKDCKLPKKDPNKKQKNLAEIEETKQRKRREKSGYKDSNNGYTMIPIEEDTSSKDDDDDDDDKDFVDLFSGVGRQRGWWLLTDEKGENERGMIELDLEVVTAEEAEVRPAGLGRSEPNMNPKLEEPDRPKTSFFWLTSPWKSFKFIIWRHNKWKILLAILITLLISLVIVWIYNLPEYALEAGIKGSKS